MDATGALTPDPTSDRRVSSETCPECATAFGRLPEVYASSLGSLWIRRCLRCGSRTAFDGGPVGVVSTCDSCGIPQLLPGAEGAERRSRCERCPGGRVEPSRADLPLAEAMEEELRRGLGEAWSFLDAQTTNEYLVRVARRVRTVLDDDCPEPRIALVDESAVRSLALPSGWIVLTEGWLCSIEDEAELTFALAHELAHVRARHAVPRLVRLGCRAASREDDFDVSAVWGETALDLIRLGYGRSREREADELAVRAVTGLGYDPEAAARYLRRLAIRAERGDPAVADTCVAHAPPDHRAESVERTIRARPTSPGSARVNREVFRRGAGTRAVASARPGPPGWSPGRRADEGATDGPRLARMLWFGGAIAAVAAVVVAIGIVLLG